MSVARLTVLSLDLPHPPLSPPPNYTLLISSPLGVVLLPYPPTPPQNNPNDDVDPSPPSPPPSHPTCILEGVDTHGFDDDTCTITVLVGRGCVDDNSLADEENGHSPRGGGGYKGDAGGVGVGGGGGGGGDLNSSLDDVNLSVSTSISTQGSSVGAASGGKKSKRDGRRESRKMSVVRSVNIMQKQNMEQQHKRKNSVSPGQRRTSILEAISNVPGFEGALGSIIKDTSTSSSAIYWRDLAYKLNHYGSPGAFFSKRPNTKCNRGMLLQMARNVSKDGVYDYCGNPAFVSVGKGKFQGTEREGWIDVGDGGCVKIKVELVDDKDTVGGNGEGEDCRGRSGTKISREVPHAMSPEDSIKAAASPPPPPTISLVETTDTEDKKYIPSGVITSFTILSPEPKDYSPPTSARWVNSTPNTVVSTYPAENAIPQMEYFLPSYPTFLSPTPPNVTNLAKVMSPSNIIDFGGGVYAAFRWTTISCGENKNFIHELTTWEKVGRGGEEYGCGVWVPVTMCMVCSLPIVGSIRRCLVRLKGSLGKVPLGEVRKHIRALATETPSPVPGSLNLQINFLKGPSIPLSVPHPNGLPPLPHGGALGATLRLLGVGNFCGLLSALLGEQKILILCPDDCKRGMVCEVLLCLLYPLSWSWPCIPILPKGMIEFVQAPVPYVLGLRSATRDVMEHVGKDVIVYDINRRGFAKNHQPGGMPNDLGAAVMKCWEDWVADVESGGNDNGNDNGREEYKINYTDKEKKRERRFRVGISLELSKYINSTGEVLSSKVAGRDLEFALQFAGTQMFSNFAEKVEDDSAVFFHDLMDLGEISTGRDRTVNAGAAVLEEYERRIENWKMPKVEDEDEGEGGGERESGFRWILPTVGSRDRSQTEEDSEFALKVAQAAAKRAREILEEEGGSGSRSSSTGAEKRGLRNRGSNSSLRSLGGEIEGRDGKVGGGVDVSLDLSEVGMGRDGYRINGIFGDEGGEGKEEEMAEGRRIERWELEYALSEGRRQREKRERLKREQAK